MAHSAWVNKTQNDLGILRMTFDLAVAGAGQGFSPVITGIKVRPRSKSPNQYVTFSFKPTAITGTNLDVALYGANTKGGTKFLLADAIVADLTVDGAKVAGVVDVQAYPAPYYFISVTGDNAEAGNTMEIEISGDLNGSQK